MDIKEIINQRYAMPDASLDRLRQCLTEVSYPKGFRVLESGKIEKDIFCRLKHPICQQQETPNRQPYKTADLST